MSTTPSDPMEFLKSLWGNTGMPLPGLVTPTLDTNELEKRITDLKAVEGWLKSNLSMLQMTIQGLEMQRATLSALRTLALSRWPRGARPCRRAILVVAPVSSRNTSLAVVCPL